MAWLSSFLNDSEVFPGVTCVAISEGDEADEGGSALEEGGGGTVCCMSAYP